MGGRRPPAGRTLYSSGGGPPNSTRPPSTPCVASTVVGRPFRAAEAAAYPARVNRAAALALALLGGLASVRVAPADRETLDAATVTEPGRSLDRALDQVLTRP